MKRIFFLFLFTAISSFLLIAQTPARLTYNLNTERVRYGFSSLRISDPYLSPLIYIGGAFLIKYDKRRFLFRNNEEYSRQSRVDLLLGTTQNPARTANITLFALDMGTAVHYHLPSFYGFQCLLGGSVDFELYPKFLFRNSNNPFNLDLAANLALSLALRRKIQLFGQDFSFELQLRSPFLGFMFVPEQGATYYGMFSHEDSKLSRVFHTASYHNTFDYAVDFSLSWLTGQAQWWLGLHALGRKHFANQSLYVLDGYGLTLGLSFDTYTFWGKRNKAPEAFKSTENY